MSSKTCAAKANTRELSLSEMIITAHTVQKFSKKAVKKHDNDEQAAANGHSNDLYTAPSPDCYG